MNDGRYEKARGFIARDDTAAADRPDLLALWQKLGGENLPFSVAYVLLDASVCEGEAVAAGLYWQVLTVAEGPALDRLEAVRRRRAKTVNAPQALSNRITRVMARAREARQ